MVCPFGRLDVMKRGLLALVIGAGILQPGGRAYAHHSFSATYFDDKTRMIDGKLLQFLFRNPHSYLYVAAPDAKGVIQKWAVEWGAAGQLGRQGVTRETLKLGDRLVIIGNPARDPQEFRLHMVRISRPSDGWKWGGSFDE
jgi:Family of unknown function (DUF6152)